jgi:hypothetical protein
MGVAREIHGGSGYWSQDSVVQVMGCPEPPTQIWIRWPGGKTTTSPIPNGCQRDYFVAHDLFSRWLSFWQDEERITLPSGLTVASGP